MRRVLFRSALFAVSFALHGCGWLGGDKGMFRDRGEAYRRAQVEKPLQIPPGLSQAAAEEDFEIPATASTAPLHGDFQVPRPQPLEGDPEGEGVKIQSLGDSRWILIEAAPGEAWPRVRQFLSTNQLGVARIDANAGVIDTAWLQPQGTARERYRFRIEQGVQRGSAEVYVLQATGGSEQWPQTSSDRAREEEMVKALAQFIADNGSTGAVSMLAQRGLESKGKVTLHRPAGGNPYVHLGLSDERAWAALDIAVQKAGFTVEDRNRTTQEMWVRFTPPLDPADEKSWWGKFWGWVFDDEEDQEISDQVVLQLKMSAEAGDAVRIDLQRQDGKPLSPQHEEDLLNRIKNKLS